ncbi:hypothetical protein ASE85_02550 [Sphingobium sp. Leaf26]|uniref:hypothetical protein n=1 Tax=Sphingobium sp. Leaf26 TaxID=1735693 RepID=UPI000700F0A2|nr:hypothetical protein [Sphingobium sp. Leaf26]KQN09834.1 hypothetical protein ASE85_02550 [Sphingobium sp. Leaf26]
MSGAKFYWARIGDGNYEPVAVTGKRGGRMAYTIGCPDPFPVDVPDAAILLNEDEYDQMKAPLTPKQEAASLRREKRYRAMQASHRYAGFGR